MGSSPDGIIFYGYGWEAEEGHPFQKDDDDFEDDDDDFDADGIIRAKMEDEGMVWPWGVYYGRPGPRDRGTYDFFKAEHADEIAVWDRRKAELAAEMGCDVVEYGWTGYVELPGHMVYVKASRHSAEWSELEPLNAEMFVVQPEWDAALTKFVKSSGANLKDAKGPGWFLTSRYG